MKITFTNKLMTDYIHGMSTKVLLRIYYLSGSYQKPKDWNICFLWV